MGGGPSQVYGTAGPVYSSNQLQSMRIEYNSHARFASSEPLQLNYEDLKDLRRQELQENIDSARRFAENARQQKILAEKLEKEIDRKMNQHEWEKIQPKYDKICNEIIDIRTKIEEQEKKIKACWLNPDNDYKDCTLLVTLGFTGSGKSTFCNRLLGDKSRKGNKGKFPVSSGLDAGTDNIKLEQFIEHNKKYLIADTPGLIDTNQRDETFTLNLIEFFRGCNGINAFLLFKPLTDTRIGNDFQQFLLSLENVLKPEFWKNVIIVAAKDDLEDAEDVPQICDRVKEAIMDKMKIEQKEVELPVISIGKEDYQQSISKLLTIIPENKYNCQAIESPIDTLKAELQTKLAEKQEIKMKYDILKLLTNN